MPIRIKKPPFLPCDRAYRIWTAVTLVTAVLLTAALTVFVRTVIRDDDAGAVVTLLTAGAYVLFLAGCIGSLTAGVKAYLREDNGTDLLQALVYGLGVIFCLLNFRFMLAVVFNALGASSAADKLIGSQSYAEFIAASYAYWVCLAIGIMLAFIIGVLGAVKLLKNPR